MRGGGRRPRRIRADERAERASARAKSPRHGVPRRLERVGGRADWSWFCAPDSRERQRGTGGEPGQTRRQRLLSRSTSAFTRWMRHPADATRGWVSSNWASFGESFASSRCRLYVCTAYRAATASHSPARGRSRARGGLRLRLRLWWLDSGRPRLRGRDGCVRGGGVSSEAGTE